MTLTELRYVVALFERPRHQVAATPIGERIVDQVRTVLRESSNLVQMAELAHAMQA